ncbi:hypothetical protein ADUPG1_012296 [Aduncisulcus paluster]|uniref:Uncharacterized protein n=1 Tax=Aduncisulcus paluster TaxID=2918883 RepID=A0ABQ5JYY8_9EUKA|nr:hypothetical protein ADUPG1_012296 [Aduncisulcus paluster]
MSLLKQFHLLVKGKGHDTDESKHLPVLTKDIKSLSVKAYFQITELIDEIEREEDQMVSMISMGFLCKLLSQEFVTSRVTGKRFLGDTDKDRIVLKVLSKHKPLCDTPRAEVLGHYRRRLRGKVEDKYNNLKRTKTVLSDLIVKYKTDLLELGLYKSEIEHYTGKADWTSIVLQSELPQATQFEYLELQQ